MENLNDRYVINLKQILERSLRKFKETKIALAFSGGVDSLILAMILDRLGIEFTCYVVGKKDSKDVINSEKIAEDYGFLLKKIIIDDRNIKLGIKLVAEELGRIYLDPAEKINGVSVSTNFVLYSVMKNCKEDILVCGLGADTLFAGFERYLVEDKKKIRDMVNKDIEELILTGMNEANHFGKKFRKRIVFPYLESEVIKMAKNIPVDVLVDGKNKKPVIYSLAETVGIEKKYLRKKLASQYGSGVMGVIKKLAKNDKLGVRKYCQGLI